MRPYTLADMHVHSEYSHDCRTPITEIASIAKAHQLMIAITDHNRIGGSLALSAMGVDVIPAIEVTTARLKDFLIYFYDQDSLIDFYGRHVKPRLDPGMIFGSRTTLSEQELLQAATTYKCVVSLAHPYCLIPKRSAGLNRSLLRRLDAVEVMNFSQSMRANQKAAQLATDLGKAHTAGSDAHVPEAIGAVRMRGWGKTPSEFLAEAAQGSLTVVGAPRKATDVKDKVVEFLSLKVSS